MSAVKCIDDDLDLEYGKYLSISCLVGHDKEINIEIILCTGTLLHVGRGFVDGFIRECSA